VLGVRCHWCMVVSPHHCLVVVVGSLHGLSMVVVGPCGWWWFCLSLLVVVLESPVQSGLLAQNEKTENKTGPHIF